MALTLPYNVGDKLYVVESTEDLPFPMDKYIIRDYIIQSILITKDTIIVTDEYGHRIDMKDFNKTIFVYKGMAEQVRNRLIAE